MRRAAGHSGATRDPQAQIRITTERDIPGGGNTAAGEPQAEAELVARACAGEPGAFDALYRSNADRVYALCLRLCGDAQEAEALVQDVFVQAWRKLDSFRGESRFSTWLHRVAVNVVLGQRRSLRRRLARIRPVADPARVAEALAAHAEGPDPAARLALEAAIARLPTGARTALVLHDIEGYRYVEIAQLTGTALGTVKAQIHRARRLLREALS